MDLRTKSSAPGNELPKKVPPDHQSLANFNLQQYQQKWEDPSFQDYGMRIEPQFSEFNSQPSENPSSVSSDPSNQAKIIPDPQDDLMNERRDDASRMQDWDPRAMLNNLSFLEQKIHQLQDLVHLIVGRRGQVVNQSDELVAQQQQLISANLTSIIVQLISTAGSLLPSVRQTLSSNPSISEFGQLGGVIFPSGPNLNATRPNQVDISGTCKTEQICTEEQELKDEEDPDEGENLPPGSYEILQLEKEEILAPHTHFCLICGKGFKRDANLRMHMRGHGDEYKTAAALAKPIKESSSEPMLIKRYSCPYAGCKRNKEHKKFQPLKTILCVKNHYKRTHCDKSYTCTRCNTKKFSVIADLKTHEKHCGRDKWLCSCGTTFSRKDKLFVQILWDVGTSRHSGHGSLWAKARVSAYDALTHYEVVHIQKSIPDFKKRNMELLTSETDPEVLRAMEVFEVKIITYEHITRRRFAKEKRVAVNKIEKLLDVFPQVIFASGNTTGASQLPGAALFCLSLTPKDMTKGQQKVQGLQDVHAKYENALVEIAASLQLSRNILIALLSLQSWKPFMQRWLRACVTFLDAKAPSTVLDKTSKAANGILKIIKRLAEESIPRSAENITLALGALCEVLPPSAHAVKSTASKFLLDWLFQYEHEHRQWSAAISLGLISSCLHVTDQKQKFQNIEALIQVSSCSRSTLVKGACGVGLGFSCQDLLTWVEASDDSDLEKETCKMQEVDLLGKIIRALSQMISQFTPSSSDLLESLYVYFPLGTDDTDSYVTYESLDKDYNDLEEDIWGIAGLVLGLGSSIGAIYRSGAHDVVQKIKAFILSWIPHLNHSVQNSFSSEGLDIVLSVGSCLALPSIVAFCQRVELMYDNELDQLVSGFRELILELVSVRKSGIFHQSLLMASCVGAGSLLACILNEGVHSLKVEVVKDLLALFRKSYSNPHPPLTHFGGMLGVANALGAGAGTLVPNYPLKTLRTSYDQKDSFYIMGPLLSCPVLESQLTSLVQEMFLVAQNSDDHQLQQYAAWAVSFLRHCLWFRELQNTDSSFPSNAAGRKSVSQNFSKDNVVMELSLWLMHLNYPGAGTISHVYTVATVLRCLSQAPRLPALDWGAIIRRCMKYEGQIAESLSPDLACKSGILREECLQLSLAHANQFDPLLSFLDELSDLSRFRTLELNLQSWFLSHLADLIKIFSGSRLEKLFDDVANFIASLLSGEVCTVEQKSLLRASCWNGLYPCMETSLDTREYVSNMENCMEVLFFSLPVLHSDAIPRMEQLHSVEWSAAVRCLAKARQGWLFTLLQVSEANLVEGDGEFSKVVKTMQAKAKLVQIGSIPPSELGKLKAYLLNTRSDGIWDVLVEVVAALQHVEGSIKKQWLVDAVEISCVTIYPSTALRFVGMLCGSCSKYMPLLVVDQHTVLSDLPVTLSSLLSDSSWGLVAESVVSYLWASTERIYDWAMRIARSDDSPILQPIDKSENVSAFFLLQMMHRTCVSLKDYLPPEKQFKLANLVVP